MVGAKSQRDNVCKAGDRRRDMTFRRGAVTQLAIVVVAPALDGAVPIEDGADVYGPRDDCNCRVARRRLTRTGIAARRTSRSVRNGAVSHQAGVRPRDSSHSRRAAGSGVPGVSRKPATKATATSTSPYHQDGPREEALSSRLERRVPHRLRRESTIRDGESNAIKRIARPRTGLAISSASRSQRNPRRE